MPGPAPELEDDRALKLDLCKYLLAEAIKEIDLGNLDFASRIIKSAASDLSYVIIVNHMDHITYDPQT